MNSKEILKSFNGFAKTKYPNATKKQQNGLARFFTGLYLIEKSDVNADITKGKLIMKNASKIYADTSHL
jgi:penicillin V acylase-like amidase (Ntn superfamily)